MTRLYVRSVRRGIAFQYCSTFNMEANEKAETGKDTLPGLDSSFEPTHKLVVERQNMEREDVNILASGDECLVSSLAMKLQTVLDERQNMEREDVNILASGQAMQSSPVQPGIEHNPAPTIELSAKYIQRFQSKVQKFLHRVQRQAMNPMNVSALDWSQMTHLYQDYAHTVDTQMRPWSQGKQDEREPTLRQLETQLTEIERMMSDIRRKKCLDPFTSTPKRKSITVVVDEVKKEPEDDDKEPEDDDMRGSVASSVSSMEDSDDSDDSDDILQLADDMLEVGFIELEPDPFEEEEGERMSMGSTGPVHEVEEVEEVEEKTVDAAGLKMQFHKAPVIFFQTPGALKHCTSLGSNSSSKDEESLRTLTHASSMGSNYSSQDGEESTFVPGISLPSNVNPDTDQQPKISSSEYNPDAETLPATDSPSNTIELKRIYASYLTSSCDSQDEEGSSLVPRNSSPLNVMANSLLDLYTPADFNPKWPSFFASITSSNSSCSIEEESHKNLYLSPEEEQGSSSVPGYKSQSSNDTTKSLMDLHYPPSANSKTLLTSTDEIIPKDAPILTEVCNLSEKDGVLDSLRAYFCALEKLLDEHSGPSSQQHALVMELTDIQRKIVHLESGQDTILPTRSSSKSTCETPPKDISSESIEDPTRSRARSNPKDISSKSIENSIRSRAQSTGETHPKGLSSRYIEKYQSKVDKLLDHIQRQVTKRSNVLNSSHVRAWDQMRTLNEDYHVIFRTKFEPRMNAANVHHFNSIRAQLTDIDELVRQHDPFSVNNTDKVGSCLNMLGQKDFFSQTLLSREILESRQEPLQLQEKIVETKMLCSKGPPVLSLTSPKIQQEESNREGKTNGSLSKARIFLPPILDLTTVEIQPEESHPKEEKKRGKTKGSLTKARLKVEEEPAILESTTPEGPPDESYPKVEEPPNTTTPKIESKESHREGKTNKSFTKARLNVDEEQQLEIARPISPEDDRMCEIITPEEEKSIDSEPAFDETKTAPVLPKNLVMKKKKTFFTTDFSHLSSKHKSKISTDETTELQVGDQEKARVRSQTLDLDEPPSLIKKTTTFGTIRAKASSATGDDSVNAPKKGRRFSGLFGRSHVSGTNHFFKRHSEEIKSPVEQSDSEAEDDPVEIKEGKKKGLFGRSPVSGAKQFFKRYSDEIKKHPEREAEDSVLESVPVEIKEEKKKGLFGRSPVSGAKQFFNRSWSADKKTVERESKDSVPAAEKKNVEHLEMELEDIVPLSIHMEERGHSERQSKVDLVEEKDFSSWTWEAKEDRMYELLGLLVDACTCPYTLVAGLRCFRMILTSLAEEKYSSSHVRITFEESAYQMLSWSNLPEAEHLMFELLQMAGYAIMFQSERLIIDDIVVTTLGRMIKTLDIFFRDNEMEKKPQEIVGEESNVEEEKDFSHWTLAQRKARLYEVFELLIDACTCPWTFLQSIKKLMAILTGLIEDGYSSPYVSLPHNEQPYQDLNLDNIPESEHLVVELLQMAGYVLHSQRMIINDIQKDVLQLMIATLHKSIVDLEPLLDQ